MSGNVVEGSNDRDAQQNVPQGAGSARVAGGGRGTGEPITWIGQQHLMAGYCGRVGGAGGAEAVGPAAVTAAPVRAPAQPQRPRDLVVRIGPKRPAETAGPLAKVA